MTHLDEQALEAAKLYAKSETLLVLESGIAGLIRSYLSALPSSPVSELVERLGRRAKTMNGALVGASDGNTYTLGYYDQFAAKDDKEAASTLTTLYTRNAELEREVKRLREALTPFFEAAEDIDDSEQDKHDIWEHPVSTGITIGDLRAVRRTLPTSPQGGEHE